MSLLAHRGARGFGRRSSTPGFLHQVAAVFRTVVGSRRKDPVAPRRGSGSGGSASVAIAAAAIVCTGLGYALGNVVPWNRDAAQGGLKASVPTSRAGVAPGPIGEQEDMRPLSSAFFLTASYRDLEGASATAKALRQAGIGKARVREFKTENAAKEIVTVFGAVVYFDGPRERGDTMTALHAVPAPDLAFDNFRKGVKDWPLEDIVR